MSKGLKLGKLPDRVPVKITVMMSPDLKKALDDYAAVYANAYGQNEAVPELIPYMLEAFLSADPKFREARKSLNGEMRPPKSREHPQEKADVDHRNVCRDDGRVCWDDPHAHDPCQTQNRSS